MGMTDYAEIMTSFVGELYFSDKPYRQFQNFVVDATERKYTVI